MEEEIKIPEFDEEKFMEKERRKAKTAFVAFLFGVFMAIICHLLWRNLDEGLKWPLSFLLAIASIGFMAKILQLLKVDINSFTKKEWFGSIAFYFFTWLAIFILSINPPFYDASPPKMDVALLPEIQGENGSIMVLAYVSDNVGVEDVKINISGVEHEMRKDEDGVYVYNCSTGGEFLISSVDKNGNVATWKGMLHFMDDVVDVVIPDEPLKAGDTIEIRVYKNVSDVNFRVYYMINGVEVNATYDGESSRYYIYKTSPSYEGWKEGDNDMEVWVEVFHYFPGMDKGYVNKIYGGNYTIKTATDEDIGKIASPEIKDLPGPVSLRTPGFGLLALVVSLALVLLRKKRR
ncbi:MAG: hypothetical protein J7L31_03410 [Thermoplasmata archaeon]|nr:hypothetical protein [Thermoplasmata archaeon]